MNSFISKLSKEYDIQIPFSEIPDKGQNSYSLDKEGNVKALYLNDVNMQNLDILLPIADKLETLSVRNCSIGYIHSPNAFFNLKKLVLVGDSFEQTALNNLIRLQNLIELDLNLTEITDSSPLGELINLRRLDLGFNSELTEIKGLENLNFLEDLQLQFSEIDTLEKIAVHENIQTMNLNSGSISGISSLERYPNLTDLTLSGNKLSKIEALDHLKKLHRLSLCYNYIDKIEGLNSLVNLEILDLSGQEIKKIEGLDSLINLKKLNLLGNELTKVENLEKLKNLEYLLLDDNRINEFDPTFLNNLHSPCYISLIANPITHLDLDLPDHITVQFETEHWVPRFV
ncbi:MAG TPA: leucine-rich repeat domain-containing protein [Fluviicola sp.]|nr:leucine-rich repeat domain-containing protein [Fluviicola sp.]